jgi:hypothetical protein
MLWPASASADPFFNSGIGRFHGYSSAPSYCGIAACKPPYPTSLIKQSWKYQQSRKPRR